MIQEQDFRTEAVRLLIRWAQHDAQIDGAKANLEILARHLGSDRDKLNKFLLGNLNRDELRQRGDALAEKLRWVLKAQQSLPAPIVEVMERVYGPDAEDAAGGIIESPHVLSFRSLTETARNAPSVQPLEGLSFAVRVANEFVPDPEGTPGEPRFVHGWSLSVLNVLPAHLQTGRHHPLFKFRQEGRNGYRTDIEGVVVPRRDRILFEGVDVADRRAFMASLAINLDDLERYRTLETPQPLRGLMLGLSSGLAPFSAPFDLLPIPGSVLPRTPSETDAAVFRDIYVAARRAAGVRDLDGTLQRMAELGVVVDRSRLEQLYRNSTQNPVFSAA